MTFASDKSVKKDSQGFFGARTPTAPLHVTNKQYVDGKSATSDAAITALTARVGVLELGIAPTLVRYVTAGTFTWTKPAHLLAVHVRIVGGGGAGGGASSSTVNNASFGGGGTSGSYSEAWFDAAALASFTTVPVVVGAGGTGVSNAAGGNGGDTSFGTLLTAPGGPGCTTVMAEATTHGSGAAPGAAGTAGTATGQSGDAVLIPGNRADQPVRVSNGTLAIVVPAGGGDSPFSTGGRAVVNSSVGGVGAFGSGGSGAVSLGIDSARAGGNGGAGLVIIEQYFKVN